MFYADPVIFMFICFSKTSADMKCTNDSEAGSNVTKDKEKKHA